MKKIFTFNLHTKILLGIFLGIITGLFFGEKYATIFEIFGGIFIKLLRMTILPFVMFSLIHGIGNLSLNKAKSLGKSGILHLLGFWTVCLLVIYCCSLIFPKEIGPFHHSHITSVNHHPGKIIDHLIPSNIFRSLAENTIPAVVLFSILLGIAMISKKDKTSFMNILEIILEALVDITHWIIRLSPIGAFSLMAHLFGTLSLETLDKIRLYFLAYALGACTLSFWIFPLLVSLFTQSSMKNTLKEMRSPILLSFTTGSVLIAIPYVIEALNKMTKTKEGDDHKKVNETLVPICYTFPTAGNLMSILFILFLAFFYAQPIPISKHLELLITGILALFGSALSPIGSMSLLIDTAQLPIDGTTLFVTTLPLTRNFQALVSTVGLATLCLLIHNSYKETKRTHLFRNVFLKIGLSLAVLIIISTTVAYLMGKIPGKKTFFTPPKISNAIHVIVHHKNISTPKKFPYESNMQRIKKEGVIRVGYYPHVAPFAYFDKKKDLMGYDIAMAYKLAEDLGVNLELIPYTLDAMEKSLMEKKIDVAMSAIAVTEKRLKTLVFSSPYLISENILIVKDYLRNSFENYELIKKRKLRIATISNSSLEQLAYQLFPKAEIILLNYPEQILSRDDIDALFWKKEQAIPWCLKHPNFTVVATHPTLGKEFYAYALHPEAQELKEFIDYWLDMKILDEFADKQKDIWIHQKKDEEEKRWSILKDVLHIDL